jgi:hypothetical protein
MRNFSTLLALALFLAGPVASSLASPPVPIPGAKLKLGTRYDPRLLLETKKTIVTDSTNNTSADPVLNGGSIRMFSTAGDVFDNTYPMPASIQWSYYGLPGQNRGYDYKDSKHVNGPVGVVRIRNGKLTRVIAGNLDFSLNTNPNPVGIVLAIGDRKYCMSFGGISWKFVPGLRYLSLKAPAPASCPASPSGAFLDDAAL